MFELQNEKGEQLFKTIAITLVCDECRASAHPELCTHKLGSLPRWISSSKVETVRTLLSEDPAMILRETLGIAADGSNKAYCHDDVKEMMNGKPLPIHINPRRTDESQARPLKYLRRHHAAHSTTTLRRADVFFRRGRPIWWWTKRIFNRYHSVDERSSASGVFCCAHVTAPHRPHHTRGND
jgi:hypothetical protein